MIQLSLVQRSPTLGRGPVLVLWHVRNWTAQQEVSGSEGRESELVKLSVCCSSSLEFLNHTTYQSGKIVFWSLVPKRLGTVVLVGLSLELLLRTLLERWRTWGSYQNAELNGSWMGPVVLLPWLAPRCYWCSGHTLSSKAQGNCFLNFLSALPVK